MQLLDILRGGAGVIQTAGEIARDERTALEGIASRRAATDIPGLVAGIEDGTVTPARDATFEDAATALADSKLNDNDPEPLREAYRQRTAPILLRAFYDKQARDQEAADKALVRLGGDAAAGVKDPARFAEIINSTAAGSKVPRDEVRRRIGVYALRYAAENGDQAAFDTAAGALGTDEAVEQARWKGTLEQAQAVAQARTQRAFGDEISGLYVDGTPFGVIEQRVRSFRGKVADSAIESELVTLNERRRQAERQADQDTFDAAVAMEQARYDAENDAAVSAGLGFAIQDRKVKVGNRERSLNNGLEEAMDRAFARINARPDLTPDQKFAAASNIASRNGFVPPVWKRTLQAGFIAATEQALEADGKEELPPPPATIAGFDLYKKLRAASPGLLETAIPDGPDRDYYETAIVLQEDPSIGDNPTRALFEARRIMSGPGRFTATDRKDIASAAQDITERFWSADAKNWPEVASHIARRAEVYVRTGIDPERAVERAAETVARGRINLHGWSIPTADANIPEPIRQDFRALADIMLEDWATKHGSTFGFDSGDVTLRPGMANGFWVVADGRTGFYVGGEDAVFSTSDLIARWKTDRDSDRMKKIRDAINAQSQRIESNFGNRSAFEAMRGMEVGGP